MLVKTGRGGRPRPPVGISFEYDKFLAGVILRFGRAGRPRPAGRETLWASRLRPSGAPDSKSAMPVLTYDRARQGRPRPAANLAERSIAPVIARSEATWQSHRRDAAARSAVKTVHR